MMRGRCFALPSHHLINSYRLIRLFGQASVVFVYIMQALQSSDGSFTLSLLLAIGLLPLGAALIMQMKDPGIDSA